ncbi:ropporin-1-like protein [Polypterus senegalus]|nr:ropporin-1-like protein [Polypterus senegalus]XP_039610318.1 ropporin-1-like protein [Polypterus senegalus]XP_039610319.1 ropporin-1-like protein [Polypterus senegalus]XP_039610320.1 ropporin-1-like protein [Polypterus senegalus]XP_039610321.1 ropporin-1-like protein [Polypterus senegalus]XP_039610323.1 ropporin-1-like protein [Polypterus senegalus]
MPLPDTMFCAEQIHIPPELPDILKQYTKAAIRTQPHDIIQWSAAYFSALCAGETLPVKERLELPVATQKNDTGLTPGLLKILFKQLGYKGTVTRTELEQKWTDLCLPREQLRHLLMLGGFQESVEWRKFFALGCSALGGTITSALKHACEILTSDPEGGAARIPYETFRSIYTYLAHLDGEISEAEIASFLSSIKEDVDRQHGMVQPRNFMGTKPAEIKETE